MKSLILNVNLTDEAIMEALQADISEIVETYGLKLFSEEMTKDANGNVIDEITYYQSDI